MTGSGVPGARLDEHGSQADRDEQGGHERHPAPTTSTTSRVAAVRMPPRWFVGAFWRAHRALLSTTRGRVGLWRPRKGRWGALQLTTTGRRTGRPACRSPSKAWGLVTSWTRCMSMYSRSGSPAALRTTWLSQSFSARVFPMTPLSTARVLCLRSHYLRY